MLRDGEIRSRIANDILVTMNWGIEDESSWDEPGCHNMSNHQERKIMLFNFNLFLGGGFKHFWCLSLFGDDSHVD